MHRSDLAIAPMRHGIDLKTHSQCQRSGQIPQYRRQAGGSSYFHPGEFWWARQR
jgi:hypothetical protein